MSTTPDDKPDQTPTTSPEEPGAEPTPTDATPVEATPTDGPPAQSEGATDGPVSGPVPEPVAEPAAEPVAEPTAEPVVEAEAEPAVKPATESTWTPHAPAPAPTDESGVAPDVAPATAVPPPPAWVTSSTPPPPPPAPSGLPVPPPPYAHAPSDVPEPPAPPAPAGPPTSSASAPEPTSREALLAAPLTAPLPPLTADGSVGGPFLAEPEHAPAEPAPAGAAPSETAPAPAEPASAPAPAPDESVTRVSALGAHAAPRPYPPSAPPAPPGPPAPPVPLTPPAPLPTGADPTATLVSGVPAVPAAAPATAGGPLAAPTTATAPTSDAESLAAATRATHPLPERPSKPGFVRHLLATVLGLVITPFALLLVGIGTAGLGEIAGDEPVSGDYLSFGLLLAGVAVLAAIVLLSVWSPAMSISGGLVWGIGLGVAYLVWPNRMENAAESLTSDGSVPKSIGQLADAAMSGYLLAFGVLLVAAGLAAAYARRAGRRWAEGVAVADRARAEADAERARSGNGENAPDERRVTRRSMQG